MRHWENFGETIGFRPDFIRKQVINLSNKIWSEAQALYEELNMDVKTRSPIYKKIMEEIKVRTSLMNLNLKN